MIAIQWARRARARESTRVITVQTREEQERTSVCYLRVRPTTLIRSLLLEHIIDIRL